MKRYWGNFLVWLWALSFAPLAYGISCAQRIGWSVNVPGNLIISPDPLEVQANAALAEGRPQEAFAVVLRAIAESRAEFDQYAHAEPGTPDFARASHALNGVRWSQMSLLKLLPAAKFPEEEEARLAAWIDQELFESAEVMVRHYRLDAQRISLSGKEVSIALELISVKPYPLHALLEQVLEVIPHEPHRLIYSPRALRDAGGAAFVSNGVFLGISHEAFTQLAPTYREAHELVHLELEANLVEGRPSDFYGLDIALGESLPGPLDVYARLFSHNEPFNYHEDTLLGIREFRSGLNSGDLQNRNMGIEKLLNGALKGGRASDRQFLISKDLHYGLAGLETTGRLVTDIRMVEVMHNDELRFRTPCVQIDHSVYVGVYLEKRGGRHQIPWFVTFDGERIFMIPLLGLSVETAKEIIASLEVKLDQFNRPTLFRTRRTPLNDVKPIFAAVNLAAKEYEFKMITAQRLKTKFQPVSDVAMLWAQDQESPELLSALVKATDAFAERVEPSIRLEGNKQP